MRRPSARALKRSLLAAVCLLAIASASTRPASTHNAKHAGAPARTAPTNVIPHAGRRHSTPRTAPRAQPQAVATTVALAYARYLAHQLPPQQLPALTPQALATATRLPAHHPGAARQPHRRRGQLDRALQHHRHARPPDQHRPTHPLADRRPVAGRRADPARPRHAPHSPAASRTTQRPHGGPPSRARIHQQLPQLHLRPSHCRPATRPHPSCEPRSPPTRPACPPPSTHYTPASQPSHSHPTAQAGRPTPTSPTDNTPTK
jgi:hypothetical protein